MTTGINKEALNLRSAPNTTARIVRVIQPNSTLTILETTPEWLKVKIPDGSTGYVAAQFVTIQGAGITQPTPPPQPPATPVVQNPVTPPPPAPPVVQNPVTPPAPVQPAQPAAPKTLIVPGDSLNVRSSPTISSTPDNKIETVLQNTLLTPLESEATLAGKIGTTSQQGLWIKVRTPSGKEGFVAAWLVNYAPSANVVVTQDGANTTVQVTTTGNPAPQVVVTIGAPTGVNGPALQPDLHNYINTIPDNYSIPQGYKAFWAQRGKLGLPDPFDISPTKLDAAKVGRMPVNGFGPNSFSVANWQAYYRNVCGMHNGLDHIIPRGTPLVAVSDGVIVGTQTSWPFMGNPNDKDIILWCFLPEQYKDSQGRRMLSNVLVAYAHLSNNTVVKRHQVVKAGDVIGISGNPAGESGNDHLHLEVHLLTGDNALPKAGTRKLLSDYKRPQPFDNRTPFNPLLFFSERLVKYHLHQGKKMGFGSGPTYPDNARLAKLGLKWPALDFFTLGCFQYGTAPIWTFNTTPWPNGIYDLDTLTKRLANYTEFVPYPADFI